MAAPFPSYFFTMQSQGMKKGGPGFLPRTKKSELPPRKYGPSFETSILLEGLREGFFLCCFPELNSLRRKLQQEKLQRPSVRKNCGLRRSCIGEKRWTPFLCT